MKLNKLFQSKVIKEFSALYTKKDPLF